MKYYQGIFNNDLSRISLIEMTDNFFNVKLQHLLGNGINKEEFNKLKDMLKSEDKDVEKLAKEIINLKLLT